MTTALTTATSIATISPVVRVTRAPLGGVNRQLTAVDFVNDNLRHIINRRMRWSLCERFVRVALGRLVEAVNPAASGGPANLAIGIAADAVVDTTRRAVNRRLTMKGVGEALCAQVFDLIRAAEARR
jgi:hypothetical protein